MNALLNAVTPALPHIGTDESGLPFIDGTRCLACLEVFVGQRSVCPKCCARGRMQAMRLNMTGRVHTYSIVHRSFPGIKTPFVSAMIALDGGGNVQGTLRGVATDASTAFFNMPVSLHFEPTSQRAADGTAYLAYYFKPIPEIDESKL